MVAGKLDRVDAQATLAAQTRIVSTLPAHAVSSITVDNGSEFAYHHVLADQTGIPTYFYDPYSAWQRVTNERFNGRLRRYLPKKTRFDNLDQEELDDMVREISNRPRKVLGFATPEEIFQELCSSQQNPEPLHFQLEPGKSVERPRCGII